MTVVHLDYELRSKADLRKVGTWNYSLHESTKILCLQYAIDDGPTVLSHPPINGLRGVNWPPVELLDHFASQKSEIHAHNAFFERCISANIGHKRLGWPKVDPMKWRCSLALCAYYALPRSLAEASKALNLPIRKDTITGDKILPKFMKPKKTGEWYWDAREFAAICEYCGVDVEVERAIGKRLGELPEYELAIWLEDQIINERGILFDRKLAEAAVRLADEAKARANIDIFMKTYGLVTTTGERKGLDTWSWLEGYDLTGKKLTKDTVPELLKDPKVPESIKNVLSIRSSVSLASVNKYKAMLNLMDDEGIIRDMFRYAGAGTLRWAGKGVQVQNLPRGYGKDMDNIANALRAGHADLVEFAYGDKPMTALKKATRGAIIARPGKELLVADYAAVEARGLMWLVGDEAAMEVLRTSCIYCDMATDIYGFRVEKKKHPDERQLGKQAILGLGYSMGYVKFFGTLISYKMRLGKELVYRIVGGPDTEKYQELEKQVIADSARITKAGLSVREHLVDLIGCKFIVDTYRSKYPLVKSYWRDVEVACREAIKDPGVRKHCGKVSYLYDRDFGFLHCTLPSGRNINYYKPYLETAYQVSFWGESPKGKKVKASFEKDTITGNEARFAKEYFDTKGYKLISDKPDIWEQQKIFYMSAGKRGLEPSNLYGGLLTENNVQAISRDLLAESLLRAEKLNLCPIMHAHDEGVIETDIGSYSIKDFEKLMCEVPKWAEGFPIAAEGFVARRYRK